MPDNYFAVNGGTKANRSLIEGLIKYGHTACVICTRELDTEKNKKESFIKDITDRGMRLYSVVEGIYTFEGKNKTIHFVTTEATAVDYCLCLKKQINDFNPTHVLVSEDLTYISLSIALETSKVPVAFICHSPLFLPFGPQSAIPYCDQTKTELLRRADVLLTVSEYVRNYIKQWSGINAEVVRFPVYGHGPFPQFGSFDKGFVLMINPSGIKGICIFSELAKRFPNVEFAVVPTWATNANDYAMLKKLQNVRIFKPFDDVDELYKQTKVLLVPSLWGEAFGQSVVEAMLRGIPVLSSDSGALREAKLGVDYLLPVNPIPGYRVETDSVGLPIPIIPEQNVEPWVNALETVLNNRNVYQRISVESRAAAEAFIEETRVERFISYLTNVKYFEKSEHDKSTVKRVEKSYQTIKHIDTLTPKQKALLVHKLKHRTVNKHPKG
jgi:glycosyltransferase involved in cell wall biosynthesis